MFSKRPIGNVAVVEGVKTEEEHREFMRTLRGFNGVVYFGPPKKSIWEKFLGLFT